MTLSFLRLSTLVALPLLSLLALCLLALSYFIIAPVFDDDFLDRNDPPSVPVLAEATEQSTPAPSHKVLYVFQTKTVEVAAAPEDSPLVSDPEAGIYVGEPDQDIDEFCSQFITQGPCACLFDVSHEDLQLCRLSSSYDYTYENEDELSPLYLVIRGPEYLMAFHIADAQNYRSHGTGGEWATYVSGLEVIERRDGLVHLNLNIEDIIYNRTGQWELNQAYGPDDWWGECLDEEICQAIERRERESRTYRLTVAIILDLQQPSPGLLAMEYQSRSCEDYSDETCQPDFTRTLRLSDDGRALRVDNHFFDFGHRPLVFSAGSGGVEQIYIRPPDSY